MNTICTCQGSSVDVALTDNTSMYCCTSATFVWCHLLSCVTHETNLVTKLRSSIWGEFSETCFLFCFYTYLIFTALTDLQFHHTWHLTQTVCHTACCNIKYCISLVSLVACRTTASDIALPLQKLAFWVPADFFYNLFDEILKFTHLFLHFAQIFF